MTLAEMLAALRKLGVRIGQHALWHQINKLGLSYKKTLHAAERDRSDVKAARKEAGS